MPRRWAASCDHDVPGRSILWFSRCPQPYADLKACGKESDRLGFNGAIRFAENGVSEKTAWHPCVESFGKRKRCCPNH